ncbi:MAG: LacI family DNA-binding transcriptional regulator [Clostridia bacterium]|nr:LacI family DNA-binding transcriptional regulator [Clostridia bacterium]
MPAVKNGATIRDVAKLAGTSPATVSRVLRDEGYPVTDSLRQRVKEAVERLEYHARPISAANISNAGEDDISRTVGVILPNTSNPFYQQAMLGIERTAQAKGYYVFVCNTMRDINREAEYLEAMYRKGIRNVVISPVSSNDPTNILSYREKGMNFVLLEQKVEGLEASRIHFDMLKGAIMATNYLLDNGHRKIALATTPLTRWTRIQVFNGYRTALERAGIELDEKLIFISNDEEWENVEEGYDFRAGGELGAMLAEHIGEFTAVVCVNDITAAGVMSTLKKAQVSVPQDVSLVSFDDISLASMLLPALTTIRFPTYDAGMLAANLMVDLIEGITRFPMTLKLEPTLIIRDTVQSIKA